MLKQQTVLGKARVRLSGFTMVELLMVIVVIALLGAVALPKFLDFRQEAKVAAALQVAQSIATGIKLQQKQAVLRCGSSPEARLPLSSIEQNDVTAGVGALCTIAQLPNESDRKIFDGPIGLFPINPVTGLRTIGFVSTLNSGETYAKNGTCSASSEGAVYGWCYDPTTGELFSANDSTGGGSVGENSGELTSDGSASSQDDSSVGCMTYGYDNYNSEATSDDGSCSCNGDRFFSDSVYTCIDMVPGCMDSSMDSYDPSATVDDGSCVCSAGRYHDGSNCVECGSGNVMSGNSCLPCGGVGQPCCSGNICSGGYCSPYGAQYGLQSEYVCTSGVTGVDRCDSGSQCQSGFCNRAQDTCSTGAAGQSCNSNDYTQCQSGLCSSGSGYGVCL